MTDPSIPFLVLGIGMLVVVALMVALVVRRVRVLRLPATVDGGLVRGAVAGRILWRRGLLRFGTDRLRWYARVSLRPGPDRVVRRADIVDVDRELLDGPDPGAEGARYRVRLTLRRGAGGGAVEFLLDPGSAAVLTAWFEAAPAGLVVGDAD